MPLKALTTLPFVNRSMGAVFQVLIPNESGVEGKSCLPSSVLTDIAFSFTATRGVNLPMFMYNMRKKLAKGWLTPPHMGENIGYTSKELRRIEELINQHHARLLEAWYGYFGS